LIQGEPSGTGVRGGGKAGEKVKKEAKRRKGVGSKLKGGGENGGA